MSEDLPKQEMLAKLLRMTTSPNDGEALVAIRKANNLLASNGWDWDKLLAGKIRIAADPFANLQTPKNTPHPRPTPPAPPTRQSSAAQFHTAPKPPPPPPKPQTPPPPPKPFEPFSHRSTNGQTNNYPGNCYCCGYAVSARDGKLFKPRDFNKHATSDKDKKHIICDTCDNDRYVRIEDRPSPQIRTSRPYAGPAPRASDL